MRSNAAEQVIDGRALTAERTARALTVGDWVSFNDLTEPSD